MPAAASKEKKASILVVDDEPSIAELLKLSLGNQGFKVAVAADGEQAIRQMQNDQYDLIITDLNMPRLDGYQLVDIVKTDFRDHKVLAISSESEHRMRLLRHGAMETFVKPFDLRSFTEELLEILKERRRSKRFTRAEASILACILRDRAHTMEHPCDLIDISIDGALLGSEDKPGITGAVDTDFTIPSKSEIVIRVSGRVLRTFPGSPDTWHTAVYFDDKRDMELLDKMAPFLHIRDEDR